MAVERSDLASGKQQCRGGKRLKLCERGMMRNGVVFAECEEVELAFGGGNYAQGGGAGQGISGAVCTAPVAVGAVRVQVADIPVLTSAAG